jgi:hypothetical protein
MSWTDWACLIISLSGFLLFLYGANYYDPTTGWIGVFLFVGGIICYLVLFLYGEFNKRSEVKTR